MIYQFNWNLYKTNQVQVVSVNVIVENMNWREFIWAIMEESWINEPKFSEQLKYLH